MNATESLEDFYRHKFNWLPDNLQKDIGHFNVFRLEDCMGPGKEPVAYSRRDFYKILLVRGHHVCHYSDKSLEVSGTALLFFSPDIPYTFEPLSDNLTGCFCIFKESFFTEHLRQNIRTLPMFAPGNKPAYILDEQQDRHIDELFGKMMAELNSDYIYKYDLIRNYVTEMIHDALKMQPTDALYHQMDANTRITMIFTELLERQFPIESNNQRFTLRSASDFAERLSVHVNHLNRAIKETTGKTTTSHIAERLAAEACILLRHTNWNISEIGYCLGFEDPAHFNHFFRKQTQQAPSAYRK